MFSIRNSDGWQWRFDDDQFTREEIKAGKEKRFMIVQKICGQRGWERCHEPSSNVDNNVLVLGDSHAVDAFNGIALSNPEFFVTTRSLGGCPPVVKSDYSILDNRRECEEFNKETFSSEILGDYQFIVINVMFDWYKPEHLERALNEMRRYTQARFIVYGNYIILKKEFPEILAMQDNAILVDTLVKSYALYEDELKILAQKSGFTFISKRNSFCSGIRIDTCRLLDEGVPFTWDQHHLSYEFSKNDKC